MDGVIKRHEDYLQKFCEKDRKIYVGMLDKIRDCYDKVKKENHPENLLNELDLKSRMLAAQTPLYDVQVRIIVRKSKEKLTEDLRKATTNREMASLYCGSIASFRRELNDVSDNWLIIARYIRCFMDKIPGTFDDLLTEIRQLYMS